MSPRRRLPTVAAIAAVLALVACEEPPPETVLIYRAPALPTTVDGVIWEAGNWEPFLPAGKKGTSWGNHRAVVEVDEALAGAAQKPWGGDGLQRRDRPAGALIHGHPPEVHRSASIAYEEEPTAVP